MLAYTTQKLRSFYTGISLLEFVNCDSDEWLIQLRSQEGWSCWLRAMR
jgi:hypothetical protein